MDTVVGKSCVEECLEVVRKEGMVDLFPARVVAIRALYAGLKRAGIHIIDENEAPRLRAWVRDVTSGKVEFEDFEELVSRMR